MELQTLLETNCFRLLEEYNTHLGDVRVLQRTLILDVLPSLADELQLSTEVSQWLKEWLLDTCESLPNRNTL